MKLGASIKFVDAEWRRVVRTVTSMGKQTVKVGVVGSESQNEVEGEGITLARLAGVHEFGAAIQMPWGVLVIPERSFIRASIAEQGNYADVIAKLIASVVDGKRTEEQALNLLGARASSDMQKRIARGIPPPNAETTIARKGSDKPLIDTGQLRQSITWLVVSNGGTR